MKDLEEQRVCVEILFQMLQQAYGEDCLSPYAMLRVVTIFNSELIPKYVPILVLTRWPNERPKHTGGHNAIKPHT